MIKSLIYIDFISIKKYVILSFIFYIVVGIEVAYNGKYYIIAPVVVYLSMILTSTSYFSDCKFKFHKALFSMPVNKATYIISKLIYSLELGVLGGVTTIAFLLLENTMALDKIVLIFFSIVILSVLLSTFQLVLSIKLGEKTRLVMGIAFILFYGVVTLLKNQINSIMGVIIRFNQLSLPTIAIITLLCCIILIFICIKVSIKLVEKKEY